MDQVVLDACDAMIRLRMSCAFFGILIPSASSTARTEASACTPVQTPQMRWVNAQASRGSRPLRITSRPRHIVPRGQRVADDVVVDVDLDAQVPLDAGDGIDDDALRWSSESLSPGSG